MIETLLRVSGLVGMLLLFASSAGAVQLEPILSGLASPLFLTHARDGSGRLFVVEQAGVIKVVGPAASTPRVFLDVADRVLSGGEQGLLGLAFHPQYAANGRFFVNYTRAPDGATVIAEYRRSADPSVASRTERVLLTIDQPFANHNGGMIAFGPDGFLYIGTGDGGSANDPGNRAQDVSALLGKMLRIDVDGGVPYAIPPDNPFAGSMAGRGEIYAIGLRNPFRFSFDRGTGRLWVGDVGQSAWEEIDVVTRNANLGWRVMEGNHCTDLGPASCSTDAFTAPIAEYFHDGGRCSITGGYVYRGSRATLPPGTYVFGDFCSGEIFTLAGNAPAVLLRTSMEIASFGEDESGELYVVDHGGTAHRLVGDGQAAVVAAVLPSSRSVTVGTPATAFATIINATEVSATGCGIALATPVAASFVYQTTDPITNALTGTANTPIAIGPRASQSFVFAITPTAPLTPIPVALSFRCENSPPAPVFEGVNTLQLSAAESQTADVVAVIAFPPGSGGLVNLFDPPAVAFFGVATTNLGTGEPITVRADTGTEALPVRLTICATDAQARCLAPPAADLALDIAASATPSFAVFARGAGSIPFDPATNRIFVRFFDAAGVLRGQTSAAVRTP